MRTTIDLPDALFIALKRRALELRQSFKELVENALRKELSQSEEAIRPVKKKIRWVTVRGTLPDIDIASRTQMSQWIEDQKQ